MDAKVVLGPGEAEEKGEEGGHRAAPGPATAPRPGAWFLYVLTGPRGSLGAAGED